MDLGWKEHIWLRLKYGSLDSNEYRQLAKALLRGNNAHDDKNLRQLALACGYRLRPTLHDQPACPPDDMRWKYWLALAMRYFPPLVNHANGQTKPNTVSNVRDWLEHDRGLIQAFLFGNEELVSAVLADSVEEETWRETLPTPSPEQSLILDIVQYHVSSTGLSERQVGNWTNELLEEWVDELARVLQVDVLRAFSRITQRILSRLSGTENPSDPTLFKEFMSRFQAANLDWAYAQALGYHNELKHRFLLASQLAPWVAIGGLGSTIALVIAIAVRIMNGSLAFQILLTGLAGLGLILVILILIRIGFLILGLSDKVEYQLKTLEQIAEAYLSQK